MTSAAISRMKDKLVNVLLPLIFTYESNFMVIIIPIIGASSAPIPLSPLRPFRNLTLSPGCPALPPRPALCPPPQAERLLHHAQTSDRILGLEETSDGADCSSTR